MTKSTDATAHPAERGFLHSSLLVFFIANSGSFFSFLFQWLAVNQLSKTSYGLLGALLALVTYLIIPGQAIQLVCSRHASHLLARDERAQLRGFLRQMMRMVAILIGGYVIVFAIVSGWLREQYYLEGSSELALTFLVAVSGLFWFLALGALQALQEFGRFGLYQAGPAFLKCAVGGGLAAIGFGLGGVMVGLILSYLLVLFPMLLRVGRRVGEVERRPSGVSDRTLLAEAVPLLITFGGWNVLTFIDLSFVRHYFGETPEALDGLYNAAATLGKTVYYLPLAIVHVTFAKVATAEARGEPHGHLLLQNLGLTVVLSGIGVALMGFFPELILRVFHPGGEYVEAAPLLRHYLLPMALLGIVAVFMHYYFALGHRSFAFVVLAGAGAAVGLFLRFHDTLPQIINSLLAVSALLTLVSAALYPVYARLRAGRRISPRGPSTTSSES